MDKGQDNKDRTKKKILNIKKEKESQKHKNKDESKFERCSMNGRKSTGRNL